jgi:hypothetical protein
VNEFNRYLDELAYAIAELGELDKICTRKARRAAKKVLRAFKKIEKEYAKLFGEVELSKVYTVATSFFVLLLEALEEYGYDVSSYALGCICEIIRDPGRLRDALEVFRMAEEKARDEYGYSGAD